jgi:secreted trypsin-like serine protease
MKSNQNLRKAAGAKEKSFKPIKTLDEIRTNKGGNGQNPSSQPETKIIGGNDADYGEYEYYVQLFYGTTSITCGGSLVAPNVVLTAAHCFSEELQYVSVGSYELALTYGDESGYAEHASIIDVAIHPLYDPENSLDHDIMVLKLDESFAQFKTLSLNFDDTLPAVGDSVTVIGLGVTNPEDDGSVATVLQELTLQTVPTDECFPSGSSFNDLVNGATEFCASSPGKAGGQDSCQGE